MRRNVKIERTEIIERLMAAVVEKSIYNVDLVVLKNEASKGFENDRETATGLYLSVSESARMNNDFETHEVEQGLYFGCPHNVSQINSKKFAKMLDEAEGRVDAQVLAAFHTLVGDWSPVATLLKEVKPFIVKGKKPSDKPRKTPERTLENTGTCGCCGQNVKMHGGRLVDHGYDIRYGFRNGKCPGVGLQPIEVSDESLRRMVEIAANQKIAAEDVLNRLTTTDGPVTVMLGSRPKTVEKGEPNYAKAKNIAIRDREGEIRFLTKTVEDFEARIAKWEPRPLPGQG